MANLSKSNRSVKLNYQGEFESLPPYPSHYSIEFQPYLKLVTIPDLDHFRDHECAGQTTDLIGSEVKWILDWLREVKGVSRVLKLRVLDSRHRPHSEQTIEKAIQFLDIEELDWKRLDLSTKVIEVAAQKVHTLHLYASGSWTPVYHWTSPGGLDSLKVSSIYSYVDEVNSFSQLRDF